MLRIFNQVTQDERYKQYYNECSILSATIVKIINAYYNLKIAITDNDFHDAMLNRSHKLL